MNDFLHRHPTVKDAIDITAFIVAVIIGTILINSFVFRSYRVVGPSMESTLYTGDQVIVNRVPVTLAQISNSDYIPTRGQVIVFKNPQWTEGSANDDEYIVKRVIALPGEHIVLKNGKYTIFNQSNPKGFNPDDNKTNPGIGSPISGEVDEIVPSKTIFVSGDHRQDTYSFDSRNGLGTIPLYDIVGPVSLRILPVNQIRTFSSLKNVL